MKIDEIIKTNFKTPQQKAIVNLRFTANYFISFQNSFMLEFDLTMPQFNILRILRGSKGSLSVNSVKERMVERSPNLTRIMDKLVSKDLIKRFQCNNDRRTVFIEINEKGLELLQNIDFKMDKTNLFPQNLTNEEAEQLSYLLDKIRNSL
jgi:MarR family 2-MHQ and catechol resistance regulon transcriptional repressor